MISSNSKNISASLLILVTLILLPNTSVARSGEFERLIFAQTESITRSQQTETRSGRNSDNQFAQNSERNLPQARNDARRFGIDPETGERIYYDAGKIAPDSEFSEGLLRKADPKSDPGRKIIIAKEAAGPENQKSLTELAKKALNEGRYQAALAYFDRLAINNPNDAIVVLGKAIALQKLGRSDAAARAYEKVLQLDADNEIAKVNLAGIMGTRDPSVSLQKLLELYQRHPERPEISAQIGIMMAEMERYDEASRYLSTAQSLEPNNPNHYFNLAILAERKNRRDEAIDLYEQALEIDAVYGTGRMVPRDQIYDRLSKLRNR